MPAEPSSPGAVHVSVSEPVVTLLAATPVTAAGAVVSLYKGYEAGYRGLIPPYIVLTELQGRFSEARAAVVAVPLAERQLVHIVSDYVLLCLCHRHFRLMPIGALRHGQQFLYAKKDAVILW